MKILAIDLGKYNSMCCFYETKTQKYRFQTVATKREYLTTVFKEHEIDLVVMEACGPSGWTSDLCHAKPKTQDCCDHSNKPDAELSRRRFLRMWPAKRMKTYGLMRRRGL